MSDEAARRRYWAEQMDAAVALVRAAAAHPLAEPGARCGRRDEAAREPGVEVDFSEKPHANGGPRIWLIRESLIPGVLAAAESLAAGGWRLVIEDCFRTRDIQRRLALL